MEVGRGEGGRPALAPLALLRRSCVFFVSARRARWEQLPLFVIRLRREGRGLERIQSPSVSVMPACPVSPVVASA